MHGQIKDKCRNAAEMGNADGNAVEMQDIYVLSKRVLSKRPNPVVISFRGIF